jgi:hypothetical protein
VEETESRRVDRGLLRKQTPPPERIEGRTWNRRLKSEQRARRGDKGQQRGQRAVEGIEGRREDRGA